MIGFKDKQKFFAEMFINLEVSCLVYKIKKDLHRIKLYMFYAMTL